MKTTSRPLVSLALSISLVPLAPTARAQPSADQQWADLLSGATPARVSRHANGHKRSRAEIEAEIAQGASNQRETAQAARQFYTSFPQHLKAVEAKKLEAICAVRGADTDNAADVQSALSVARAYRQTLAYAISDRFDVALAMDRLELSVRVKQHLATGSTQERLQLADRLRVEFGDLAALHDYYLQIARSADTAVAVGIARDVEASRMASPEARSQAREIGNRAALSGKKIHLKVAEFDGQEIDLAKGRGKVTVVFAWRGSEADSLQLLLPFLRPLRKVDLVCLGLGGTAEEVASALRRGRPSGAYCHVPAGARCREAIERLKLQYAPLPWVFVLDAAGSVIGSGSVRELSALLAQAGV